MAEEGPSLDPSASPLPERTLPSNPTHQPKISRSTEELKCFIDNEFYVMLQRHFLMQGKGRRPDLPPIFTVTNGLLLQLFFMKEESNSSFNKLKSWLQKLVADTLTVSESLIYHRIQAILDSCSTMEDHVIAAFLLEEYHFNVLSPALTALGITRCHIINAKTYDLAPTEDITNEVVVALSQILIRNGESSMCLRNWLRKLCLLCMDLTDSQLKTKCENVLKKYKNLSKNKKGSNLNDFINSKFIERKNSENRPTQQTGCNACIQKDYFIKEKERVIRQLKLDNECLVTSTEEMVKDISMKNKVIEELQKLNADKVFEIQEMKPSLSQISNFKKEIKRMEGTIKKLSDAKLYYRRNIELKKKIENLEREVKELRTKYNELCIVKGELLKKVKNEQDMKNNYKKKNASNGKTKENLLYALNNLAEEENLPLKQKENKCTMYSDEIRQLYMTLQGEANVAASQASKVVSLVAKHLFKTEISLADLPCPRSCLNFMDEAHHIAKQQIVSDIRDCNHFTYATDGTSRQKKHYMEHHIILDNGSMLSVGYSEVANDKADTLLQKSLDLFDEISDVYCQTEDMDNNEVFKDILVKMQSLMSDRAANMKAFNRKMLEHKKNIVGEDATVHFLYCNAHFLIGLADATEKAVRMKEDLVEEELGEKLGRANQAAFAHWSSDETCASRLIRTSADVFGPRGDEKNGCREEWLSHCDSLGTKSKFTSHRSNRFNNIFENSLAILFHSKETLYFLQKRVSHSNRKLQSICFDLQDKRVLSIIAAIALLSVHLTTPYWSMMNSKTPYGQFPAHVKAMKAAFDKWSSEGFDIDSLHQEPPLFGNEFMIVSDVPELFIQSDACDKALTATVFKMIVQQSRQSSRDS